jgi:putative toxin-antitoxin system antitoxin component (TIGR02293 family)
MTMEATLPHRSPPTLAAEPPAREWQVHAQSRQLLGGPRLIKRSVHSRSEVHSAILEGIPYASVHFLIGKLESLDEGDVASVLGISARTLQRQKVSPKKAMPVDLASKAWMLAETLAKASEIFGSREEAEAWMARPAMGLDGQRPIDLLRTLQGAEIVNDFLTRLEYGVYS